MRNFLIQVGLDRDPHRSQSLRQTAVGAGLGIGCVRHCNSFDGSPVGHGPEDRQAVALGRGDEFLQIGFRRRGGRRAVRRLTHRADKFRERAAAGHQQHAGRRRPLNAKTLGDSARAEGVIAGAQGDGAVCDHYGRLAVDDVEQLVLVVMNVPGRSEARRDHLFDEAEGATRLRPAGADPGRQRQEQSLGRLTPLRRRRSLAWSFRSLLLDGQGRARYFNGMIISRNNDSVNMERGMRRPYRMTNRAAAHEETRERIVRATMALHDERGVATTSFADVAQRAGVGPATVFRHFPTLGALVMACGAHVAAEMRPPSPADAPAVFEGLDDDARPPRAAGP